MVIVAVQFPSQKIGYPNGPHSRLLGRSSNWNTWPHKAMARDRRVAECSPGSACFGIASSASQHVTTEINLADDLPPTPMLLFDLSLYHAIADSWYRKQLGFRDVVLRVEALSPISNMSHDQETEGRQPNLTGEADLAQVADIDCRSRYLLG